MGKILTVATKKKANSTGISFYDKKTGHRALLNGQKGESYQRNFKNLSL